MLGHVWVAMVLIVFLGATILAHEFGHYLAARLLGLVVKTFSIGFGPALWKRTRKGIVYKIGWIPFGGYVALPQLDPAAMDRIQSSEREAGDMAGEEEDPPLPRIAPWKKIVVSLSGAVGNVALAVIIAWIVYAAGIPASPSERSAMVGYVQPDGEAYAQGLRMGDTILSVNGKPVSNWREVRMEAALNPEIVMVARSAEGEEKTVALETVKGGMGEQSLPGVDGRELCMVLHTMPDSAAEAAGLQPHDIIVAMAGREVVSIAHMIAIVEEHRDRETEVDIRRVVDGEAVLLRKTLVPRYDEEQDRVLIGIAFNLRAVDHDTVIRPTPREQLSHHATAILRVLRALTSRRQARAAQAAVGGPVAVITGLWFTVSMSLMLAVWFTGFLNVNLAIINLLPIPVLDGGHIMFSLWELIVRRPVKVWIVETLVNACMVLLLVLILLLSFRDVDRIVPEGAGIRRLFRRAPAEATAEATAEESER